MKKLVVLLAAVMMFAFSATAYAATFTDLEDKSVTVQDAVAKTVALGIIDGYTDGTFGADKNITRAEFAKIAVTAAGSADTATMLEKTASSFKDVKAGAWYTGWINAAEALGLVQGVGNGNYNPNATITNQEVVTVLMRMLGYNDNLPGNWPVNYVTQANKDEILDRVAIVAAAPATRGDVVVMLDDALDTGLVTYDKDTNEFVAKQVTINGSDVNKTLLDDSFNGKFVKIGSFDAVTQVKDAAKQTLNWEGMIIDDKTEVSYNGGSLFSLEGHAGKVYFVEKDDKEYVRFIEVESYTKTTGTKPELNGKKIEIGKTTYNATADCVLSENVEAGKKNSKYIMYFNDDDQVYAVISDLDLKEDAYYVKSIKGTSFKLAGNTTTTVSLDDDEVLVYTEDGFIAPSELKVGDAVMEYADDLFVKVDDATGELTKTSGAKATIGGTAYVYTDAQQLDDEYETSDVAIEDVYGNDVRFLLNKDNSIAAMILGDDITGNTLYGIVVDGDSKSGSWSKGSLNSVTLFTAEGTTVEYDFDDDADDEDIDVTAADMGYLVEYELNKDGEIKEIKRVGDNLIDADGEIEVKNNKYLVGTESLALASNVVIFEVGEDDGEVDAAVVTRAAVLAGGDFEPEGFTLTVNDEEQVVDAYALYDTNSNGAIKVLAYTDAASTDNYGVVDGDVFENADYDEAIMLVGDENVYEQAGLTPKDEDFIVYTKSGDKITVTAIYGNDDDIADQTEEVTGVTDGLLITEDDSYMTDDATLVYVINAKTGEYEEGTVADITKNSHILVVAVDDDDYVDCVLVDEYTDYNA